MSLQKHRKTYGVFLAIIIGLIVISFVFTGVSRAPKGGVDTVATVGDTPVREREYQLAVDQTMQFANTYFGGKLRKEDIEQFKRRALDRLIQGKLMLNIANRMDLTVGQEEVTKTIKSLPYFQTKQGFNLDLYKQALAYQGMTPAQFEESLTQDLKVKELSQLMQSYSVSQTFINEIKQFQDQKLKVAAVKLAKKPLEKFIAVSDAQIEQYLKEEANRARVKSAFENRKAQLDRPEEVRARHILFKVGKELDENSALNLAKKVKSTLTAQNFAKKADELTQDPSGKGKGGDLGWFTRGRMVPEFEQVAFTLKSGEISEPVKSSFGYHLILVEGKKEGKSARYEDYEKSIAKELIQGQDAQKLDAVVADLEGKIAQWLAKGDRQALEEAKKTYNLLVQWDAELNRYDGTAGSIPLEAKSVEQIFAPARPDGEIFRTRDAATVTLVKVQGPVTAKAEKDKSKAPSEANDAIGMAYTEKLFQEVLKKEQENTKIRIYRQI